jgi:hypothetical protein
LLAEKENGIGASTEKLSPRRKSVVTGCEGTVKLMLKVAEGSLSSELVVAAE